MDKKKPILLFFENLVEPILATKAEFELIEKEIDLLSREFLLKGVFAYILLSSNHHYLSVLKDI